MFKSLISSKAIKILLGFIGAIFLLLYLLPILFQERIETKFRKALESQLLTESAFTSVQLTFFKHFPSLTLSTEDLLIIGSPPFGEDTLFFAQDFSIGLGLISLTGDYPQINELFLNNAVVKIKRDIKGKSNFDIIKVSENSSETDTTEVNEFGIELTKIKFQDTDFIYEDTSLDILISAKDLNYDGNGKFVDSEMDLTSDITVADFQLSYAGIPFLNRDRVEAALFTEINTESTTLSFTRNNLLLNQLPVDFRGKLEFIPGGYDMNFILESFNSGLEQIFSIFPEQYFPIITETEFSGEGDLVFSLQGLYLPEEGLMPSMALNFQLREGMMAHQSAEYPITNLRTSTNIFIPGLDPDKLEFTMDSLGFEIGEGFLKARLQIDGMSPIHLDTELQTKMNIGALNKALGTKSLSYSGELDTYLNAKGIYAYEEFPKDLTKTKLERYTIPSFILSSSFRNGYLKWEKLPEAMEDINFDVKMSTDESIISSIKLALENLNLKVLNKLTQGSFSFDGNEDNRIDATLTSQFDLGDIQKFYPLDSGYQLRGVLDLSMRAAGNIRPQEKQVPITKTSLILREGYIKTPFDDHPIEDIRLELDVESSTASLRDLSVDLKPVFFLLY